MSNLLPAILALSATFASTIKPSAIALLDFIPDSSINTPFPVSSYNTNVKLPSPSLPICILIVPFSSLNCCIEPVNIIEPSVLLIVISLVSISPAVNLLAVTLSIMASFIIAF